MSVLVVFDSLVEGWLGVGSELVPFSLYFVTPAVFSFLFFHAVELELAEFDAFV